MQGWITVTAEYTTDTIPCVQCRRNQNSCRPLGDGSYVHAICSAFINVIWINKSAISFSFSV